MKLASIDEIREFFFHGMMNGWATGAAKHLVPGMPGFMQIIFSDGRFTMIDRYCVVPIEAQDDPDEVIHTGRPVLAAPRSSGLTTIWFEDVPVWQMSYHGQYTPQASAFVKCALRAAYGDKQFFGGRGPSVFEDNDFSYHNEIEQNRFAVFRGCEKVWGQEVDVLEGFHRYMGMLLS